MLRKRRRALSRCALSVRKWTLIALDHEFPLSIQVVKIRGDRLPWGFEECTSPPSAAAKIVAAATPFHIKRVFVMSDEPPRTAWWRGLKRILKRNHSMELVPEYDVPALHAFNDSLATYLAGLALLHKAKAHVIAQTDWCQARRPRPGARLSYPGKKDKKISYMLSRQRYAEWLPTALNVTGCSTFSKKRGTGAGHGSRGHG